MAGFLLFEITALGLEVWRGAVGGLEIV